MDEIKIIGRKPVIEAFEANLPIKRIYLAAGVTGEVIQKILSFADQRKVNTTTLNRHDLQRMAGPENHQGIIATMASLPVLSIEALLQQTTRPKPVFALLDGVEDPRNFGAILRAADGSGIDGVIIPERRSASLSPGAIKSSAGAAFHMPVAEVTNLARAIDFLKENQFWIVGTDMTAEQTPWQVDFDMPTVIVLGSEGKGMRRLIREKCDFLVKLPMLGKVESLNVATTAAILFYEIVRQRTQSE
ncbi:MAG: 23S rRNA (guanosine(2251)-2'-O)-methyltransferase RlmB [Deferribacteres bacterium]|nr:23S rRNA (guanosine(2251)-2'-O)-methyltransferase RlmB [candidate division KSB1 bacterium]MCB9508665.1 23S rRNA (guanosine(2251)-2'-O)-methyltransferase RlmB [Deferribacteres bacterium]